MQIVTYFGGGTSPTGIYFDDNSNISTLATICYLSGVVRSEFPLKSDFVMQAKQSDEGKRGGRKPANNHAGRPDKYNKEAVENFCKTLGECGSVRIAAEAQGWSETLVHGWKKEFLKDGTPNPSYRSDFAEAVCKARAGFELARLKIIIAGVPAKEGHEWKADVWLLEHLGGAEFGGSVRKEEKTAGGVLEEIQVDEEDLARLQERRRRYLEQDGEKE